MIDPFDEVEVQYKAAEVKKETKSDAIIRIIKVIYDLSIYILKVLLVICVIFFLLIVLLVPEKGIILQPFECNGINVSDSFIPNYLCFELQNIKGINEINIENPGNPIMDKRGSADIAQYALPSIKLEANSLDYSVSGLGNVGAGPISVSLGHLILSLKQFIGRSSPKLVGSIQGSRSELRIIAILDDPKLKEGLMAWEIKKNISNSKYTVEENIPMMMEDLAYQIVHGLINENKTLAEGFPRSWEAFEYLTMSKKAYILFNETRNSSRLNESKYFALRAKESEPMYSNMAVLFVILGSSYLEIQNYPEAERLFNIGTQINPFYPNAWNGLGVALLKQGKNSEAVKAFDNISWDERTADMWYNIGWALYYLERYSESAKAYNRSIQLANNVADTWYNMGLSLATKGYRDGSLNDINNSIKAFNKAIEINSNFSKAWDSKGRALFQLGRYNDSLYNDSLAAFNEATDIDPMNDEFWADKGKALSYMDKYDDALAAFNKAIEIDPKIAEFWNGKGDVLFQTARPDNQIDAADKLR